ncbi:MAG: prepilin-type N-terminal cleavage/methylation domain-containing protein [Armatimonadota bacterium]
MNRLKHGFTLIEIIVVIGIIAILAGVILPVTMQTRRRSKSVICINNMHQIGLALQSYAQDWSGCAPPYTTSKRDRFTYGATEPPSVIELAPFNDASYLKLCFAPYGAGSDDMWFCPIDADRGNPSSTETFVNHAQTSYFVDEKMTIWRPVMIDSPPILSKKDFARGFGDGTSLVFWIDIDDIDMNAPFYIRCFAAPISQHGAKYPVLRFDGSIVFATTNKGINIKDLEQ